MLDPISCAAKLRIPLIDLYLIGKIAAVADRAEHDESWWVWPKAPAEHSYDIGHMVPELADIMSRCRVGNHLIFIGLPPGYVAPIHQDDADWRKCVIIVPVSPKHRIAPTTYHHSNDAAEPWLTVNYELGDAWLLNTEPWHGIKNNDQRRVSLQISLHQPYEEILDRIRRNDLFDGLECHLA